MAGMDDGLLLTCMWYIREVDPQTLLLTGLTRDGVYRVEGGEITGAVNNFRYNESPIDLLRRFTHASETVPSFSREWGEDFFSRTATPAFANPRLQHELGEPSVVKRTYSKGWTSIADERPERGDFRATVALFPGISEALRDRNTRWAQGR